MQRKQDETARTLEGLPTDVFGVLLSFLSVSDLKSVALLNRRCYSEANGDLLWCLLCQRAGLSLVAPAGGCAWKSFAQRTGVVAPSAAAPQQVGSDPLGAAATTHDASQQQPLLSSGSWSPLVGYARPGRSDSDFITHDTVPFSMHALHRGAENFPWYHNPLNWTKQATSHVAPVAILPIGQNSTVVNHRVEDIVLTLGLMSRSTTAVRKDPIDGVSNSSFTMSNSTRSSSPTPLPAVDELAESDRVAGAPTPTPTPILGPRIQYFDVCPLLDDTTRALFLKLSGSNETAESKEDDPIENAKQVAKLVEVLWSSASTLIFLYDTAEQLIRWGEQISPFLHDAPLSASTFCTDANTPNVFFVPSATADIDLAVLCQLPSQLRQWLSTRATLVECCSYDDAIDQVMPVPKRYRIPGWVSPLVSPHLLPCHLLEMISAAALGSHLASDLWCAEVMQGVIAPLSSRAKRFYTEAMRTEIDDRTENGLLPLDYSEIVMHHRHFFFAALRSFSMQLNTICGADEASGTQLMEMLKRDLNTMFREIWRENSVLSKHYSTRVFQRVFDPVIEEFVEGEGFKQFSVAEWTDVMMKKIEVFRRAAPGPRAHELLVSATEEQLVPQFMGYANDHPELKGLPAATENVRMRTLDLVKEFRASQHEKLSRMQRETAVYTAAMGNERIVQMHADCCATMLNMRPDAERWAKGLEQRCSSLGVPLYRMSPAGPTATPPPFGEEPDSNTIEALPSLRVAAIQEAMSNEGQQRASNARSATAASGRATPEFLQEVAVVRHEATTRGKPSFFSSLRQQLRRH